MSRLASCATQALVRPSNARVIGHSLWHGIKTGSGPKKAGGGSDPSTINPPDPHTASTGYSNIFIGPGIDRPPPAPKTAEDFKDPPQHWISYGFDLIDKENDRLYANVVMFLSFTVIIVGWGTVIYYYPDIKLENWSHREAYLEIERRSKLGRPYISKDYVPADRIVLPTEEELGDTEIII